MFVYLSYWNQLMEQIYFHIVLLIFFTNLKLCFKRKKKVSLWENFKIRIRLYNNRPHFSLKIGGGVGWTSLCVESWKSHRPLLSKQNEVYYCTVPHEFSTFYAKWGPLHITSCFQSETTMWNHTIMVYYRFHRWIFNLARQDSPPPTASCF